MLAPAQLSYGKTTSASQMQTAVEAHTGCGKKQASPKAGTNNFISKQSEN